jgi:hypothetical protein
MNAVLLAITGVSLALAAFMSAVAWRMRREERRRSDARVAMLAAEIYKDDAPPSERSGPLLEQRLSNSWTRPLVTAIAGAGIVATIGVVSVAGIRTARAVENARSAGNEQSVASAKPVGSARLQASDAITAPLELLSLEQERDGERLIVRGIVRNPADAAERDGLDAVVLLLGHDGDVVTSARAALPAVKLAPGATSPFVVQVTHATGVNRFRLSFRSDTRVEPHVDRRTS